MRTAFTCPLVVLLLFTCSITSCSSVRPDRTELQEVARNWCLTIRASQISPVYPLTEDLQPGDIFLYPNAIADDLAQYDTKGFLPLEDHFARLMPTGYADFYINPDLAKNPRNNWQIAPQAVFPSFSFVIQQGSSLNAAFPIQGIPAAFAALGSHNAIASLSLSDVVTVGVDHASLFKDVETWAQKNRELLAMYAPTEQNAPPRYYLRVVRRIYLAGRVSLIMTSQRNANFSGNGGANSSEKTPLSSAPTDNPANSTSSVPNIVDVALSTAKLQHAIDASLPGAQLKVTWARENAVAMDETFVRPLVVGYLAFDIPIQADGRLGPGISSEQRFERKIDFPATTSTFRAPTGLAQEITSWLNSDDVQAHHNIFNNFLKNHGVNQSATSFLNAEDAPGYEELMQHFVEEVIQNPQDSKGANNEI
ncbi:MAG TPA: hypothetical protein VG711_07930 [Phycisphaerales bacterium]|nr:hypothetical protein [Phycisphaerales bacterium]